MAAQGRYGSEELSEQGCTEGCGKWQNARNKAQTESEHMMMEEGHLSIATFIG